MPRREGQEAATTIRRGSASGCRPPATSSAFRTARLILAYPDLRRDAGMNERSIITAPTGMRGRAIGRAKPDTLWGAQKTGLSKRLRKSSSPHTADTIAKAIEMSSWSYVIGNAPL